MTPTTSNRSIRIDEIPRAAVAVEGNLGHDDIGEAYEEVGATLRSNGGHVIVDDDQETPEITTANLGQQYHGSPLLIEEEDVPEERVLDQASSVAAKVVALYSTESSREKIIGGVASAVAKVVALYANDLSPTSSAATKETSATTSCVVSNEREAEHIFRGSILDTGTVPFQVAEADGHPIVAVGREMEVDINNDITNVETTPVIREETAVRGEVSFQEEADGGKQLMAAENPTEEEGDEKNVVKTVTSAFEDDADRDLIVMLPKKANLHKMVEKSLKEDDGICSENIPGRSEEDSSYADLVVKFGEEQEISRLHAIIADPPPPITEDQDVFQQTRIGSGPVLQVREEIAAPLSALPRPRKAVASALDVEDTESGGKDEYVLACEEILNEFFSVDVPVDQGITREIETTSAVEGIEHCEEFSSTSFNVTGLQVEHSTVKIEENERIEHCTETDTSRDSGLSTSSVIEDIVCPYEGEVEVFLAGSGLQVEKFLSQDMKRRKKQKPFTPAIPYLVEMMSHEFTEISQDLHSVVSSATASTGSPRRKSRSSYGCFLCW